MILSQPHLPHTASRIVSLVPSQTELLHFLGLETQTIGITKFCIHPDEWRKSKIIVGGTKNIDIQKIKDLCPTLIIANKEENLQPEIEELASQFPTWVTDVNNLEDALKMITDIGLLTGTETTSKKLVEQIEEAFLTISSLPAGNQKIRTAYLIWRNPYMTAGVDTFINSMLQFAGLTNAFGNRTRYPEVSVAELQAANCELLLLSSEPYPFAQKHIAALQEQLPHTKILLADGEMFSWYGSRLLKVPAYLSALRQKISSF